MGRTLRTASTICQKYGDKFLCNAAQKCNLNFHPQVSTANALKAVNGAPMHSNALLSKSTAFLAHWQDVPGRVHAL